jgi:ketosteroid isomerase-like protein
MLAQDSTASAPLCADLLRPNGVAAVRHQLREDQVKQILQVLACVLAVAVGIGALLAGSNSSTSGDAEQILASERAWAQAAVKGDVAGMARLMSDDYVEIVMQTGTGTSKSSWLTISKTEWVHLVQSGREKYTSVDLRNLKVNLHGDVATVSGEYSQTVTKDGKDIGSSGLYVDTWVKKNGNWQVVSSVFP